MSDPTGDTVAAESEVAGVADVQVDLAGPAGASGSEAKADAGPVGGAGGAGAGAGAGAPVAAEEVEPFKPVTIDYSSLSQEGGDKLCDVSVLVGSWNVGNEKPLDDFAPFIPAGGGGYGIIVVGGQEAKYSLKKGHKRVDSEAAMTPRAGEEEAADVEAKSPSADAHAASTRRSGVNTEPAPEAKDKSGAGNHFFRIIQNHVGPTYSTVATVMLWEMRLIVLAKKELMDHVSNVNKAWEATGIMHVGGNKGGLVVQFDLFETSLCFVSCHLAAHAKFLAERNKNVEEVLSEVRMGRTDVDLDAQFHHTFWLGDLNYRVQLNVDNPKRKIDHMEHFNAVKKMIDAEDWAGLYAKDQLKREMAAKRVFVGFQEAPPTFPPTFKVERKPVLEYKTKRIPSYCDRVLWKSLPGRGADLVNKSFAAFPTIGTSDHKPVAASFSLRTRTPVQVGLGEVSEYPVLVITGLQGSSMYAADPTGLSDPYVRFHSNPPGLLHDDGEKPPQTLVCYRTLNPKFPDDKVPHMRMRVTTKAQLAKCSIVLCVWDWDRVSADDRMGQAVLGLEEFVNASRPTEFRLDVVRSGIGRGTIKGNIQVLWPGDDGYDSSLQGVGGHGCCSVM